MLAILNMSELHVFISTAAHIVILLNILQILLEYKKMPRLITWFNILLLLSLVVQVLARVLWLNHMNNLFLLHIYTLFEFIFLGFFYSRLLTKYSFFQKYHLYFIAGISLLIVLNTIFLQPITGFNNNAKTLTQVIYIGYAVAYFFQEAATTDKNAQQRLLTLINSAILLYYAGSLFIFMFGSIILKSSEHYAFWIVNALLYLIFQLLVFIALWTFRQRTKSIGS